MKNVENIYDFKGMTVGIFWSIKYHLINSYNPFISVIFFVFLKKK